MSIFRLSRRAGAGISGSLKSLGNVTGVIPPAPTPTPPPPAGPWTPPNISLLVGQSGQPPGQFNVAATGPGTTYAAGGVYDASGGTLLPVGATISAAGMLDVGTAAAATADGVVFGYTEPGAFATLTLHPTNTGTFPYMASIYPLEGTVPAGSGLYSPEDASLRSTTLSAWEDGSAKVMVLAGTKALTAPGTTTLTLRPQPLISDTALTAAFIASKLTNVSVNFNSVASTFTTFSAPDRIWWANSQLICAQYRMDITGMGQMQAIIYVHAYAGGRCFIEVMIENGKLDVTLANPNSPVIPSQAYTAATVSVTPAGGAATLITLAGGVSSPTLNMTAPNSQSDQNLLRYTGSGGHERGRAWYCSGWTNGTVASIEGGAADPLVDVTHDTLSLQAHPWFFKPMYAATENMQTKYNKAWDTYVPWAACRLRQPSMPAGGDSDQIALHTSVQSDYIITGNKYVRKAVFATGLALSSSAFHYRHIDGTIPTKAQTVTKYAETNVGATWPKVTTEPAYGMGADGHSGEAAHSPSICLIEFLCRPSPLWIEHAWQEQNLYITCAGHNTAGALQHAQVRERSWRNRSLAMCIFLTPDTALTGNVTDTPRKEGYREVMRAENQYIDMLSGQSWNTYGIMTAENIAFSTVHPNYSIMGDGDQDLDGTNPGWQGSFFQMSFAARALHAVNGVKVLTGVDQTLHTTLANRLCRYVVDWINGTPAGDHSWRIHWYQPTIGYYAGDINSLDNHGLSMIALNAESTTGIKPTAAGAFQMMDPTDKDWSLANTPESASYTGGNTGFGSHIIYALQCAIERDLAGATAAWTRVYGTGVNDGGLSNWTTWSASMATDPKQNRKARNLP